MVGFKEKFLIICVINDIIKLIGLFVFKYNIFFFDVLNFNYIYIFGLGIIVIFYIKYIS